MVNVYLKHGNFKKKSLQVTELSKTKIDHVSVCILLPMQGTHGTGKTGKMTKKKSLSGKSQGIWKISKKEGICFAQVVNSLVKDISIFAAEISKFL